MIIDDDVHAVARQIETSIQVERRIAEQAVQRAEAAEKRCAELEAALAAERSGSVWFHLCNEARRVAKALAIRWRAGLCEDPTCEDPTCRDRRCELIRTALAYPDTEPKT